MTVAGRRGEPWETAADVAIEQAGETPATRLDVRSLVRSLQDVLGQRLVAVIAGVSNAAVVGEWARGDRTPRHEAERRLRNAFHIVQLLLQQEATETVRAWFIGMNPDLDDRAPVEMLADDPDAVLLAARSFLVNG